jgi:hypothetical protein
MFILSLAIADLTVGAFVMPISATYVLWGDWPLGRPLCQLWLTVDYTASTASIFNLLILSLDRYWSIRTPLQYLCKRTRKRALAMICLVWLLSASWALPILFWHRWTSQGTLPTDSHLSSFRFCLSINLNFRVFSSFCRNPLSNIRTGQRKHPENVCETEFSDDVLFKLTSSTLNFIIPLCAMVMLYVKIYVEIKRRGKFDIGRCSRTTGRNPHAYTPGGTITLENSTTLANCPLSSSNLLLQRNATTRSHQSSNQDTNTLLQFHRTTLARAWSLNVRKSFRIGNGSKYSLDVHCAPHPIDRAAVNSSQFGPRSSAVPSTAAIARLCTKRIIKSRTPSSPLSHESRTERTSMLKQPELNEPVNRDETESVVQTRLKATDRFEMPTQSAEPKAKALRSSRSLSSIGLVSAIRTCTNLTCSTLVLQPSCREMCSNSVDHARLKPLSIRGSQSSDHLADTNNNDRTQLTKPTFEPLNSRTKCQHETTSLSDEQEARPSVTVASVDKVPLSLPSIEAAIPIITNPTSLPTNTFHALTSKIVSSTDSKCVGSSSPGISLAATVTTTSDRVGNGCAVSSTSSASQTSDNSVDTLMIQNNEKSNGSRVELVDGLSVVSGPKSMRKQQSEPIDSVHGPPMQSIGSSNHAVSSESLNTNGRIDRNQTPVETKKKRKQVSIEAIGRKWSLLGLATNHQSAPNSYFSTRVLNKHRLDTGGRQATGDSDRMSEVEMNGSRHADLISLAANSCNSGLENSSSTVGSVGLAVAAAATAQALAGSGSLSRVESSRLRQEQKAARQLGVIIGGFLICWLPYIGVYITTAQCNCISSSVHTLAIWLGYFNSTLNPFLYALCNDSFKQAFRKLLGRGSVHSNLEQQLVGNGVANTALTGIGTATLALPSLNATSFKESRKLKCSRLRVRSQLKCYR